MSTVFNYASTGRPVAASLFDRHLLIVGQTGSGKTTTALSLLWRLQEKNQTAIILDPTGEYARLPHAVSYRLGTNAYLSAGRLTADELLAVLGLSFPTGLRRQLPQAIDALRIQQNICQKQGPMRKRGQSIAHYQGLLGQLADWARDYDIRALPDQLVEEMVVPLASERADYTLLGQEYDYSRIRHNWQFIAALRTQLASLTFRALFDTDTHPGAAKTELGFVLKMFLNQRVHHRSLVIDLSVLKGHEHQQGVVISYLLKLILNYRLASGRREPSIRLVLDEGHRYLPTENSQLARNGIFQILREGRKVNLSMVLTTQSPIDLPGRLRSQFATLLVHRLLSPEELSCLPGNLEFAKVSQLAVGQAELISSGKLSGRVNVTVPSQKLCN